MKRLLYLSIILPVFFYCGVNAQTGGFNSNDSYNQNLQCEFKKDKNRQSYELMDLSPTFVDSVLCFNEDNELIEKHIIEYNSFELPIKAVIMRKKGAEWENHLEKSCIRNSTGLIEKVYEKRWDGSKWIDSLETILILDDYGNVVESRTNIWKTDHYLDSTLNIYTYNENGDELINTWFKWDGSTWINDYKMTFTWDYSKKVFVRLDEIWSLDKWENYSKLTYSYTLDPNKYDTRLREKYRNGSWIIDSRYSFKYDSFGNEVEWLIEYFRNNVWENGYINLHEYNSQGKLVLDYEDVWANSNWQNEWKITYDYSPDQIIAKNELGESGNYRPNLYYYIEGYIALWTNCAKTILYTHTVTDVAENFHSNPEGYSLCQNFPNPFNPATVIRYHLPENCNVSLRVFDILGRETAILVDEFQQAGDYKSLFKGDKLSSGIYFYRFNAGKYSDVKKMILLR